MNFLKSKKILIVDDDTTTRLSHSLLLKKLGATDITEACDVDEALNVLETHTYDLILSDFIMPEKTGLDLYKELILRDIHTPFSMITANGDSESVKEMISLGITAILVKPITKEMLVTRLSRIL